MNGISALGGDPRELPRPFPHVWIQGELAFTKHPINWSSTPFVRCSRAQGTHGVVHPSWERHLPNRRSWGTDPMSGSARLPRGLVSKPPPGGLSAVAKARWRPESHCGTVGASAFKSKSGIMVPIRLPPFPLRLHVPGHSLPGTSSAYLLLPPLRPMLDLTGAGPQASLQCGR